MTTYALFLLALFCACSCFEQYIKTSFKCGLCGESLGDMQPQWARIDHEIARTPLPAPYAGTWVRALCNDCHTESDTPFHIIGLKCYNPNGCGSYNTAKIGWVCMIVIM